MECTTELSHLEAEADLLYPRVICGDLQSTPREEGEVDGEPPWDVVTLAKSNPLLGPPTLIASGAGKEEP